MPPVPRLPPAERSCGAGTAVLAQIATAADLSPAAASAAASGGDEIFVSQRKMAPKRPAAGMRL